MNVIFVDDDIDGSLQSVANDTLPQYPRFKKVRSCVSVKEAQRRIIKYANEIDIAIIDQFIGSGRGTELGAWLNENYPHIICIMLTGGGSNSIDFQNNQYGQIFIDGKSLYETTVEAMEVGFSSFILKNILEDDNLLYKRLDQILSLPSVKAKQAAKANITKLSQTWEEYKNSLLKYDLADTTFMHIRLLCIETVYRLHSNLVLNYPLDVLVPFLEKLCQECVLSSYDVSLRSFSAPNKNKERLNELGGEILPKVRHFLSSIQTSDKFPTEEQNTEWRRLKRKAANPSKDRKISQYFTDKKHIEERKHLVMKVLITEGEENLPNLIREHCFTEIREIVNSYSHSQPLF